jgi:hypothetical protein
MRSPALRSADVLKAAFGAAALALSAAAASAQGASAFREVRLDLSGLPPGAADTKRQIGACLSQNLPLAFAGRVNAGQRNLPVLIVRPTGVWLSPPVPPSGDARTGGSTDQGSPDVMEGEAFVGATRIPLLVSGGSERAVLGAPLAQALRRTDSLCHSFAYWLARKV